MKKKFWLINHYSGITAFVEGGRHYWFAKELVRRGYEPTVFCCNVDHDRGGFFFPENKLWQEKEVPSGAKYVFVRSNLYGDNGKQRVLNMIRFSLNMLKVGKEYAKKYGKPDVILASSVHPLTVYAGERLAKKFGVPCVAEIRDLWPESIFAYFPEKRGKWYAKMLYWGERRMYERADAVVMTWPGAKDYLLEQGWDKTIDMSKVYHIGNGVDLEGFDQNVVDHPFSDPDLEAPGYFKAVYAGSIRKVNNLGVLVEAAAELQRRGDKRVKILVWGSGDELETLQKRAEELKLTNLVFKGRTDKKNIPSLLTQCDCAILHNSSTALDKYGQSQNKFIEYLASGRPILMTYSVGYSVCKARNCGLELDAQTPEKIADALERLANMPREEYETMARNARETAKSYDFKAHTDKLVEIVENL